ncbi:MAG: amidohydrolase [Ferruginibacter sp.]|nr:amidohydrolase [Cytophagales bacterium]
MKRIYPLVCLIVLFALPSPAQDASTQLIASIESRRAEYADVARQIWGFAEVGYQEVKSSALLQSELKKAGFTVEAGVAEIPTAFVASYGSGKPVIVILAEYDALPGLSQDTVAEPKSLVERGPGHGCGHHLFGTASVAAAVAVKDWLARSKTKGTIKLMGTPAEEGGSGKVYMVRAGLFKDADAVLHWHPGDDNEANPTTTLANITGKFRFYGLASHAAAAPERGRSALDGVESMNYMVNMMREHVDSDARIHYVITRGGEAPNVVPAFAEVYYYARHQDIGVVRDTWSRIEKAAEGAAMGTGTRVEREVIGGVYNLLPNETLATVMHRNLTKVGGVAYTNEEKAFAEQIRATTGMVKKPLEAAAKIEPFGVPTGAGSGSTDVGDVSWAVPTVGLGTATWVPGTPAHSWQAVASGGRSIGTKGMLVAAKTLALTAYDLFRTPATLEKAKKEFEEKRGADFKYSALLGDRKPALDYRK